MADSRHLSLLSRLQPEDLDRLRQTPLPLSVTGATKVIGLIGDPVEHSLSPMLHNTAIRALGLPYIYVPFLVPPADLPLAIQGFRSLNIQGLNVTHPHKERVIPLLDGMSESARIIGAVNTVIRREGKLIGDNTDAAGFGKVLDEELQLDLAGKEAVVLGVGGAGKAVGYTLAKRPLKRLTLVGRNPVKAEHVARKLAHLAKDVQIEGLTFDDSRLAGRIAEASLLVNATPLGMTGHAHQNPNPYPGKVQGEACAYDLIYAPPSTPFLVAAAKRGARTLNGLSMLLSQAEESFAFWTGVRTDFAEHVLKRLAGR